MDEHDGRVVGIRAAAPEGDVTGRTFVLCPACIWPVPCSQPLCGRCGSRRSEAPFVPVHATQAEAMHAAREEAREPARLAAAAIRAGLADRAALGECRSTFMDARPRYWHRSEWTNAPGFAKTVAGSTRARTKAPVTTFSHRLLPGWNYAEHELWELLQDLDNLAAGRGWPTTATDNAPGGTPAQAALPSLEDRATDLAPRRPGAASPASSPAAGTS